MNNKPTSDVVRIGTELAEELSNIAEELYRETGKRLTVPDLVRKACRTSIERHRDRRKSLFTKDVTRCNGNKPVVFVIPWQLSEQFRRAGVECVQQGDPLPYGRRAIKLDPFDHLEWDFRADDDIRNRCKNIALSNYTVTT